MHIEMDEEVLAAVLDAPGLLSVVFEGRNVLLIPSGASSV